MTNDFKNKQSSGARPPRLSPEEYAAKKKAEKEAVYQLLDNTALEVVQSPEKFKAYLDVQSRMDRYTANNALLMYKQFPQASQIIGRLRALRSIKAPRPLLSLIRMSTPRRTGQSALILI